MHSSTRDSKRTNFNARNTFAKSKIRWQMPLSYGFWSNAGTAWHFVHMGKITVASSVFQDTVNVSPMSPSQEPFFFTCHSGLPHSFVSQGTAARHDANLPLLMDVPRHDACHHAKHTNKDAPKTAAHAR